MGVIRGDKGIMFLLQCFCGRKAKANATVSTFDTSIHRETFNVHAKNESSNNCTLNDCVSSRSKTSDHPEMGYGREYM